MTHTYSYTFSSWVAPHMYSQPLGLQKQLLREVGLRRWTGLVATQDTLLSVSPFNKQFFIKLDLLDFSLGS